MFSKESRSVYSSRWNRIGIDTGTLKQLLADYLHQVAVHTSRFQMLTGEFGATGSQFVQCRARKRVEPARHVHNFGDAMHKIEPVTGAKKLLVPFVVIGHVWHSRRKTESKAIGKIVRNVVEVIPIDRHPGRPDR